ncbi:MAG: hypothetical protein U1F51_09445 [Burkholderiales bacterium]
MDERSALDVIAARAAESAGSPREVWSDEARAWASRAAAGLVGESAGARPSSRRAALVLERLSERGSSIPGAVASLTWRPWVGSAWSSSQRCWVSRSTGSATRSG